MVRPASDPPMRDPSTEEGELPPPRRELTVSEMARFLEAFGSARAVREQLATQHHMIQQLRRVVQWCAESGESGPLQATAEPVPALEAACVRPTPTSQNDAAHGKDDSVAPPPMMAVNRANVTELEGLLYEFGSTQAIRERLDTQSREIAGLQRTARWLRERVIRRRKLETARKREETLCHSLPTEPLLSPLQETSDDLLLQPAMQQAPAPPSSNTDSTASFSNALPLRRGEPDNQSPTRCGNDGNMRRSTTGDNSMAAAATEKLCRHQRRTAKCETQSCNEVVDSERSCCQRGDLARFKKLECPNGAHLTASLCTTHSNWTTCKADGCTNQGQGHGLQGYCARHDGGRYCKHLDCTKLAVRNGACSAHGRAIQCMAEGCDNQGLQSGKLKGYCVRHGGGLRCKHLDCTRNAVGNGMCVAHGGADQCKVEGCKNQGLRSGELKGYCTRHGGGRQCNHSEYTKRAVLNGVCAAHGGVRQCKAEGCERQGLRAGELKGYCIRHGGGPRCKRPDCAKAAVGNKLCAVHGGATSCKAEGCKNQGRWEGKLKGYCVTHGGGRRCKYPLGCTKGAAAKGLCCRHGGRVVCKADNCNKCAQKRGYCATHFREFITTAKPHAN